MAGETIIDILSDVLKNVRLSGAIFFDVVASAPWVAAAPPSASIVSKVMPGAQRVIEYHVITGGSCWGRLVDAGGNPVKLTEGSVIMFPQGDRHILSSGPRMRAEPDLTIFEHPEDMAPPFRLEQVGREVEQTQIICGFIGCDLMPFNPLLHALPRMIHIPGGYNRGDGWLKGLIQAIRQETDRHRAGNQSVLSRLSELLFIEVVRCYAESLPGDATGWLAALADPGTSRAIHLLHRDPARAWTLAELAKETGMSRTVLVNRFTGHLGVPPMTYLQNWRMQIAAQMLMDQGSPLSRIAAAVGYESEAAFSRAFKRHTDVSPGMWRKRHLLEEEA